jgi:hypothetical protein
VDPYKGVTDSVRELARKRSYENMRQKIAVDVTSLMKENGLTTRMLAKLLGISVVQMRCRIWKSDLTISQLHRILDEFSYEMVPVFRKRWPATEN